MKQSVREMFGISELLAGWHSLAGVGGVLKVMDNLEIL